jgi:hypothetical protein
MPAMEGRYLKHRFAKLPFHLAKLYTHDRVFAIADKPIFSVLLPWNMKTPYLGIRQQNQSA